MFVSEVTLTQDDLDESCTGSRSSSCNKNDYWNACRKKCEANGAHLATAAELKVLKAKGTISSDYYWAAEADSNYANSAFLFDPNYGNVNNVLVRNIRDKAVCVSK